MQKIKAVQLSITHWNNARSHAEKAERTGFLCVSVFVRKEGPLLFVFPLSLQDCEEIART
jgi:hypothetical protein